MKLKTKKPLSKAGIITAIVLTVLLILFIGAYSKRGAFSQINLFGASEAIIESQNLDSDNDGLKDWQEKLYQTDANNPDTDADGYLDGEEVDSGHNPLVKAPGDSDVFYPLPLGTAYNVTSKVLTDENIDTLFGSYFSQKEQFLESNPTIGSQEAFSAMVPDSTIQEMAKRAFGDVYLTITDQAKEELAKIPTIFEITVSDKDIKISEDNSKEAIQEYINQAASIINSENFFITGEAFETISTAINENNFSGLDSLIIDNDAKIGEAKNLTVPSTWKDLHKNGMELTILIRNIYVSFRDMIDDPLKAYIASGELDKFPAEWKKFIEQVNDLAKTQGIIIPTR